MKQQIGLKPETLAERYINTDIDSTLKKEGELQALRAESEQIRESIVLFNHHLNAAGLFNEESRVIFPTDMAKLLHNIEEAKMFLQWTATSFIIKPVGDTEN